MQILGLTTEMQSLRGISAPIGPSMQNPYTDPSMAETADDRQFSQSALRQTTAGHRSANDAVIAQREMEINDIAQGIIQLADIFTDLQAMVIDQGTVLDRIDYNIENMAINVKEADKELKVVSISFKQFTLIAGHQLPAQIYQEKDHVPSHASCGRLVDCLATQTKTH